MTSQYVWWQRAVIYQVYPRSFQDSNGDGIGDLPGITSRLGYLADTLGVDAIWLSPFYPSPMADFGYDVKDYCDVDPLFGMLRDFDELLEEAHCRGLKVIIDFVPNHTSDQHPWFTESHASRTNPKQDWYIWKDPKPDGGPPNNWLSVFGGGAWEWDENRRQYYLHSFLKEQPDLNWRNPEVCSAMHKTLEFWLRRGVDGFRIDVAHFIMKDPELRDNPLNESRKQMIHKPMGDYDSLIHVYDQNHPDIHKVYRQIRSLLDAYGESQPRVSIGEIHLFDLGEWVKYYGENLDEIHMPFNFSLLNTEWKASSVRKAVEDLESALPPGAWPNYVLGNHDESRLATRLGEENARLAAMLLLTLRGTPTLYYGDEIGMWDVEIPEKRLQDPWGRRVPGLGRDPCRTPMQWTGDRNAGFSSSDTPELWLPLDQRFHFVNVQAQLADPHSILSLYRKLLTLRKQSPDLQVGGFQAVDSAPEDCFVYLRMSEEGGPAFVALNFASQERMLHLEEAFSGEVLVSTYLDREGPARLDRITLRPKEGLLARIKP